MTNCTLTQRTAAANQFWRHLGRNRLLIHRIRTQVWRIGMRSLYIKSSAADRSGEACSSQSSETERDDMPVGPSGSPNSIWPVSPETRNWTASQPAGWCCCLADFWLGGGGAGQKSHPPLHARRSSAVGDTAALTHTTPHRPGSWEASSPLAKERQKLVTLVRVEPAAGLN